MARIGYREGDWFAVPVGERGKHVLGVIARASAGGTLVCYFFGERFRGVPKAVNAEGLVSDDAVLVGRCGDRDITTGAWPLLGPVGAWSRERWRTQTFKRVHVVSRTVEVVIFDDDNPEVRLFERPLPPGEDIQAPEDGLMGGGFVEERLTRLTA